MLQLDDVKPHEDVEEHRLTLLTETIRKDGHLIRPIAIDRETRVILDGHHRVAALRRLGCTLVPVYEFDYKDPDITVLDGRSNLPVDKATVVTAALTGKILPPKSTRHMVLLADRSVHISEAEKENPTPLSRLRRSNS